MNSESWHARLTMCLNPPTLPIHKNLLSAQPSWPLTLPCPPRVTYLAMNSESWYARLTMCLVLTPSSLADSAMASWMALLQVAGGSWLIMVTLYRTCA